jgi:hypothetical protein
MVAFGTNRCAVNLINGSFQDDASQKKPGLPKVYFGS